MSTAPLQSPDLDWLSLSSGLWAAAAAVAAVAVLLLRLTEHPLLLQGTGVCLRVRLHTVYANVYVCVRVGRAYFEESERVGERERCVRFG